MLSSLQNCQTVHARCPKHKQTNTFCSMQTLLYNSSNPSLPLPHGQRCDPCHKFHFPIALFSFCSK